jgi:hypothetical protein
VAACGGCTTTADCCPGSSCILPTGSTRGICGPCGGPGTDGGTGGSPDGGTGTPDGGTGTPDSGTPPPPPPITCAQYGQICTVNSDCCNGIPCSSGRCGIVPR